MAASGDTEITLGTGKMLALFFGLVALCAVFFGMGFSLGKSTVKTARRLTSPPVRPWRAVRVLPPQRTTSSSAPSDPAVKSVGQKLPMRKQTPNSAATTESAAAPGTTALAPPIPWSLLL